MDLTLTPIRFKSRAVSAYGNKAGIVDGDVRLASGRIRLAELHCYEAHGIGKKELKRKQYLD